MKLDMIKREPGPRAAEIARTRHWIQRMDMEPTLKRSALLVAIAGAFLLAPGMTTAGQTNALTDLTSAYEGARIEIGLTYVQREQDCLKQYGKALDALMVALKRSGDLKTYLVVETEKNRLSAEGTVPPAKGYIPALANPVKACRQAVAAQIGRLHSPHRLHRSQWPTRYKLGCHPP